MIGKLYTFFAHHTRLLLLGYLCFVVVSIICFSRVQRQENIEALLPDTDGTTVRRDFNLLQQAPFARKILIDLHYADTEDIQSTAIDNDNKLKQAAVELCKALQKPLFNSAIYAPPLSKKHRLDKLLLQVLPNLVTEDDLNKIEQRLTDKSITGQLHKLRDQLLTPQGWWSKRNIRQDPLQLWQIGAGHLRQLNPMSKADREQLDFVSADGTHRLVVVDTSVTISDVVGSRQLIAGVHRAINSCVPEDIVATIVSGHMYTLANADTIQHDLKVVLGTASAAILLIFLFLLRSWRALFVFLLPASVLGIAAVAVATLFPVVSGITIGFGAVLLGITVDFTLHVYFSLRGSDKPGQQQQLRCLSSPLIGSALTSFLAFSIMLNSALPGQRQLAVFSMTAIALSLALALVVMPHLCGTAKDGNKQPDYGGWIKFVGRVKYAEILSSKGVVLLWLVVMLLSAVAIPRLNFDGNMRSLSVATDKLHDNEQLMRQVWGNMRSSALLFAQGNTLDEALQVNDKIVNTVLHTNPAVNVVSLAALLPASDTQRRSRVLWRQFWDKHGALLTARLARAGAMYGFSAQAFTPFFNWLGQEVQPVSLGDWQQTGMADIISSLMVKDGLKDGGGVALISLIDEFELTADMINRLETIDNAVVVAPGVFSQQLSRELEHDFSSFIYMAFAMVVAVLVCWYRSWRHVILALLPMISGLLFMLGCMGWLGINFNLFNVIATILIIGLGVDYGIFVLSLCDGSGCQQSRQAVLVSALTTLAGFGALVLAQHPAMYSIGISVLFGISAAVLSALFVLPRCYAGLRLSDG